jgi:uncharacterized membrane protein YeaQ/YmgE (transglycosylase-associated protein family)
MLFSADEVTTWLIVGALAGSLAGILVKRRKAGFGHVLNLGIGLAGALIGGFVFKILKINLGLLGQITISLQQVVAAVAGALMFLAIVWGVRCQWAKRQAAAVAAPSKPSPGGSK